MSEEKKNHDSSTEELEREWNGETSPTVHDTSEEGHGVFIKKELDEKEEHSKKKDRKKNKKEKKKKHSHHKEEETEDVEEAAEDRPSDEIGEVVTTAPTREKAIADQLSHIYENSDGSMPDMKTFESRKTSRFVRALIIFLCSCLFFGAAAWVGLFVLQPRSQFSETDVTLSISGEDSVTPGNEVTYRIRYRNAQSVTLDDVVLEVRYPGGFKVTTSTKPGDDENNTRWSLGSLDPGSGGYIDVTGRFFGDSGSEQSLRSFLSYKPENFTSTFQAVATKTVKTTADAAALEVEIAEEVPRGGKTPITITISPASGVTLENVQINCISPEFTPDAKSTPTSEPGSPCSWSFEKIADKTVIDLSGIFNSTSSTGEFALELRGWDSKERTGDGYVLARLNKSVSLIESTTNISLVINGGSGDTTITPGETISASIVVQNKGDVALTDVSIDAIIDGPSYSNRSILGWQDLKLTGDADVGGEQLTPDTRRGKITWNKQYVPELASIAPGREVQVDVSIPVRSGDQITLGNFTTNNIVFVSSFSYGKANERKTIAANQINLTLISDFSLKVDHEVDSTSGAAGTYAVSWTLSNSFHPLKNITLEADIYGDITVDETKITPSAGTATYKAGDKKIIWTIPEMPTSVDVLNLDFEVVLKTDNPTQKDLLSKVKMSAEDEVSKITIKKVGEGIQLR